MKSDHLIEEIKSRIDIVDLIAEHVSLKQAGQNYKGLCPFHSEKTPSFTVSPSKQIFHCFGCHKGGDIFSFVTNYENMTFNEAVSYLAGKAGVKTDDFRTASPVSKSLKESLLAINKEASVFFKNNLSSVRHALSYLKDRGIKSDTIERFSIGFSRNDKDSLFNHLKALGFKLEHIKASGLVYFGEGFSSSPTGKGEFDFFRNRLMFPIFNIQENVIAFGGRILAASKNAPKYINSPDSIIFKKGESSYGLNIAKNHITDKGYSIIVEGYLDAIMCHQCGFSNTIAPLGTALTAGQLKKIKRFSNKVLLIFDGDPAGISATRRSLELIYSNGMLAKVILLPAGEDPDTFLRKHGEEYFRKYISKAVSPVEFLLNSSGKSKLEAVRYILQLLSSCPDLLQRDEEIRELSFKAGINELTLREELKKQETIGRHQMTGKANAGKSDVLKNISGDALNARKEEQMLLQIAVSGRENAYTISKHLDINAIDNYTIKSIFSKISNILESGGELSMNILLNICDAKEQNLLSEISFYPEMDTEGIDKTIEDCLKTMHLKSLEKRIDLAGRANDVELLHSLLSEKKSLSGHNKEKRD